MTETLAYDIRSATLPQRVALGAQHIREKQPPNDSDRIIGVGKFWGHPADSRIAK